MIVLGKSSFFLPLFFLEDKIKSYDHAVKRQCGQPLPCIQLLMKISALFMPRHFDHRK